MNRFRSKEEIIDCATQLQLLYYSLPGSDEDKRAACYQHKSDLTQKFVDSLLHEEFANFCVNIQNYNLYDFVESINIIGQCRYNAFEDGYPVDPITQEQMKNWKTIGITNGYGYDKGTISQLTTSGFTRDPLTNVQLSTDEIEDRDNAAEIRTDEFRGIYDRGVEGTTSELQPRRLNFDQGFDE